MRNGIFVRRIDGFDVAERFAVKCEAGERDALQTRDVRGDIWILLPVDIHVGDAEAALLGKAGEDGAHVGPWDRLEVVAERQDSLGIPPIGEMEEIALFFGQDDAVGFELPADARHHLADAMYGVRLVHAEADGVVDGSLLEQHFIEADIPRQLVVEIQAGAVVAGAQDVELCPLLLELLPGSLEENLHGRQVRHCLPGACVCIACICHQDTPSVRRNVALKQNVWLYYKAGAKKVESIFKIYYLIY